MGPVNPEMFQGLGCGHRALTAAAVEQTGESCTCAAEAVELALPSSSRLRTAKARNWF